MDQDINRIKESPTTPIGIRAAEWGVLHETSFRKTEEPMTRQDHRQIKTLYGKRNCGSAGRPLTAKDLARFRALLLEYREEVLEDLKTERETLSSSAPVDQSLGPWDPDNTAGTESSENAAIQIRRLSATLEQLTAALSRLERGSYGNCTRCGMRIEKERLEAIPYTRRCMTCKTVVEAA